MRGLRRRFEPRPAGGVDARRGSSSRIGYGRGVGRALLALGVWLAGTASARGAPADCDPAARRWVAVRLHGPGWSETLADAVWTDLRAELRRHGTEACPTGTAGLPVPIATLDIEARTPASMRLGLDIVDRVTGKRSERSLELDSIPLDGHSLAVAVAADELLTSSWIKLVSPRPPVPAARTEVLATATAAPGPGREFRHELALLLATERFGGGAAAPGLDLAFRRWWSPRWALELGAGARAAHEESAPHGRVRTRCFPLSLRLLAGAVPHPRRWRAGGALALVVMPMALAGEPAPGAAARDHTVVAAYARGELWGDVRLGRLRLRVAAGTGLPLRSVTADDGGVAVKGGARGVELHGRVGLGVEL